MHELATQYGFSFDTLTADIDERAIGDRSASASPEELVLKLARAKAEAILGKMELEQPGTPAYLITCDQVVVHIGRILEKPEDAAEVRKPCQAVADASPAYTLQWPGIIQPKSADCVQAREFIAGYSSAPAATVGSVIVQNVGTGRQVEAVDTARIHFKPIPSDVVEQLIKEGTVFKCAGALMIEHPLVEPLITCIDGTPDSVMGLPKHLVLKGLLEVSDA